jgi:transposase-like protein
MSLVNTETGELVPLDPAAAERRAERISLRLDSIADNYAAVMPMIREALDKRDHFALGYRSPGEYVSDRFGGALQRLGMEVRREVVRELTQAGMSTRAIAPVVGVSQMQVVRDQARETHVSPQTPEAGATDAREAADRGITAPRVPQPPVTGIDGKTYTPRPRQVQRDDAEVVLNRITSLTDQAARAAESLTPAQIARVTQKA